MEAAGQRTKPLGEQIAAVGVAEFVEQDVAKLGGGERIRQRAGQPDLRGKNADERRQIEEISETNLNAPAEFGGKRQVDGLQARMNRRLERLGSPAAGKPTSPAPDGLP